MAVTDANGARRTPIPQSFVQRAIAGVRYAITGVTPETWFGPSQPLKPFAPPETAGRAFDYPFGQNLRYIPRSDEPISFADLRALSDADIVRLLIETRKDQLEAQNWEVRPCETSDGNRPKASQYASEIKAAKEWMRSPDKVHDLAQWIRLIGEDLFALDAPTLYKRLDRKGRIYGFEVIDGSTIVPLIDSHGRMPMVPSPAYQQVLHGVPASDYTSQELIYYPRNPRPHKLYGLGPVEQIILTINILMRRNLHQLAFYTDGNLTDAMFTAPQGWTSDQIKEWQNYWNSIFQGDVSARRQGVWVPQGTTSVQTKQPVLKDQYDDFLMRVACFAFSISPLAFISHFNRATAETAQEQASDEGLIPVVNYFERLFALLLGHMGLPMLEIAAVNDETLDAATQAKVDDQDVAGGLRTRNQVRVSRGWERDPNPAADMLMVTTPQGPVPIDANLGVNGQTKPPQNQEPNTAEAKVAKKGTGPEIVNLALHILNRPVLRAARQSIAERFTGAFATVRDDLVATLKGSVTKMTEEDGKHILETLEAYRLTDLDSATQDSIDDLAASAADSGHAAVMRLGITDDTIFNQINPLAVSWAKDHAAEMVTQISTATRNMLRKAIVSALDDGATLDDIAGAIKSAGAFSPERAQFIAETEVANANGAGSLAGLKEAASTGLEIKKTWLISPDACPICIANAAEGAIKLDAPFLSGDFAPLAHPNCRCALGHEIVEDAKPAAIAA